MSYIALARKYRPRNFTEMVGQAHVVQALTNALTSQRLHHAYMFTGTRGVGKTTVSRILAKSLNCEQGITSTPCGVCAACTEIDAGRFVDYTELDAASNRGVEEVQSLLEQAAYKPVQGRFKVFMIDEVHMLTGHAFNAMLKTLEEPPQYMKFVLATTDPQKVPVTVLSRCLQFNLRPIAHDVIAQHLDSVLCQENISFDSAALNLIGRAAHGSMRDALSLTDQAIAYTSGSVEENSVRHMLGVAGGDCVFDMVEALANGHGKALIESIHALRIEGLNPASILEEITQLLQHIAIFQVAKQDIGGSDEHNPRLIHLTQIMPASEVQLLYSICLKGREELGLASDEYAAMTMILLRFLAFSTPRPPTPLPSLSEPSEGDDAAVKKKVEWSKLSAEPSTPPAIRQAIPPSKAAEKHEAPIAPTSEQSETSHTAVDVIDTELGDFWFDVVQHLIEKKEITALVKDFALKSQLLQKKEDQWLLRLENEIQNRPTNIDKLVQALHTIGHAVQIKIEGSSTPIGVTDSPSKRLTALERARQAAADELIHHDPWVKGIIEQFDAKIVAGSIKALL